MSDSLSDTVRCAVAQHLDVEVTEIRSMHRFERDLGLQLLDVVLIALRLEEVENVELPIEDLDAIHKVADLTALLRIVMTNDNFPSNDNGEARNRRRYRPKPVLRRYLSGA
jgi:acyl carrier protein